MKLIQQTKLYFQDAKSDKVYEVDLCEVGPNAYLVNFRYGRRGAVLRSGTKTELPVELTTAQALFDKLVVSKTKKGYKSAGTPLDVVEETPDLIASNEEQPTTNTIETPLQIILSPEHIHNMIKALEREMNELPASAPKPNAPNPPSSQTEQSGSMWGMLKRMVGLENDSPQPASNLPQNNSSKKQTTKSRLSRLVWRCGELKLEAALDHLLMIEIGKDAMLDYSLAWALGRIKSSRGINRLSDLFILGQEKRDHALQSISRTAQVISFDESSRKQFVEMLLQEMPENWQKAILNQETDQLVEAMHQILEKPLAAYFHIADLYLLDVAFPTVRKAILQWMDEAPVKGSGYFRSIRQLLKAAELRDDAELLGLIAYKIQKGRPNFQEVKWGYKYLDGKYQRISDEIVKPDSRLAFSSLSKRYFVKRFVRNLRRKGAIADPDFVRLATGMLLNYKDADMVKPVSKTFWRYVRNEDNRWTSVSNTFHYPHFAPYPILAYLLFGNSERLEKDSSGKLWRFRSAADPKVVQSNQREEAFPELWNQQPQGLLHLLVEAQCEEVHDFAVKAARDNHHQILSLVNLDFAKILLGKKYKATILYGLDLLKAKLGQQQVDPELVLFLLQHEVKEVRDFGLDLLSKHQVELMRQSDFVSGLLFVEHEQVRSQVDNHLKNGLFTEEKSVAIIGRAIAKMMAFSEEANEKERQQILVAGEHLSQHFQKQLYQIHFDLVYDLLNHPLPELKVFAGKILRNYQTPVEDLPEDLLLGLINGESAELRAIGVELFGKLPDSILLTKIELLTGLCVSTHQEVRQNIMPVVKRLAGENTAFGENMVQQLAPHLLRKEATEGRDEDLLQLLTIDLDQHLAAISLDRTLQLLYAPRKAAHRLGAHLLHHFVDAQDLTIRQIVRLGSNELIVVRQWVWKMYAENLDRIKYESREAVRLLDVSWEDSRDWAFDFFRSQFKSEDWNPDVLVSICDSVFPMVQQFGREMITQHFKEEDGEQYLLQLSEHPSPDLQQFATNYLEQYAADQPKRVENLEHYFTTLLAQVNKAGVAKKRIFAFLKSEGIKNEATAAVVARVIIRQSASMAIGDKSRCIQIMRNLSDHFPQLDLPLLQLDFETYPTFTQKENA